MFERILVPLDGSEGGESVFQPLRQMLRRKDAEVILLQAVDVPALAGTNHSATILLDMENDASEYLKRVESRLAGEGLRVRSRVQQGPPAESILGAAASEQATLIALSTHGRSGFVRLMLGSVAEEVLRRSPVPVLVWRSRVSAVPGDGDTVGTILVPFDGSGESLAVAPCVIETARLFGASVAVVKVEEASFGGVDVGFVGHLMDGPVDVERCSEALDRDLMEAGNPFAEAGLRTTVFRVRGDAALQINKLARLLPAGLIAMSTHGRSGISRLISGSVTEQVVRTSERPVLVLRSAAPAVLETTKTRGTP